MGLSKSIVSAIVVLYVFFEGRAQSIETIAQKFEAYQAEWKKTKIHLIFNQDKYSPGDTAFFKAYFLKEDLSPIPGKQLIDFDMVDSSGQAKLHSKFKVIDGIGQNQMAIPEDLPAGIYLAVAYSSWMKNFDPTFIFKKEITIVHKNRLIPNEKQKVKVFSEGGHLIAGIPNKVGISTYKAGSAVQIIDEEGQQSGATVSDTNGIAILNFTPIKDVSYFAALVGGIRQYPLPQVESDGIGLRVHSPAESDMAIKVLVNAPSGSPLRTKNINLLVTGRGKIHYTATFMQGTKNRMELEIPLKNLPEGIARISLLSNSGNLLASRAFYAPGVGAVHVKIKFSKPYFRPREEVKLEVSLMNANNEPIEGEFSIKVLNATLFDEKKENSLADEVSVFSFLDEKILIDRSDQNWEENLDNLLMTATEEIPWQKVLSKKLEKPRFPFTSVLEKFGTAYYSDADVPLPDYTQIMFYLQKSKWRYQTFVKNGKVSLAIPDIFSSDEFFYLAQTKKGKEIVNARIVWAEDEPIKLPTSPVWKETGVLDKYAEFADKSKLINKSYGFYSSSQEINTDDNLSERYSSEKLIATADITISIEDYARFGTMEELIKEVIPFIKSRSRGDKKTVRISLLEPPTGDPLYIIDGIATKNTSFFLSLNPSDLITVKLIKDPKKLPPLGLMGINGIVIVKTKTGDVREPLDDPFKLIEGLSKPINLTSGEHSGQVGLHKPNFQSTIYWNPSVKTDSNGRATVSFFCTDDVGKLSIRIDGLAAGGRPFSGEESLEVVLNSDEN